MEVFNLCIAKPNPNTYSETFIKAHIDRLPGNKRVIYGGAFPLYDHNNRFLIRSKLGLLSYLIQKRILKKKNIPIRTKALARYLRQQNIDIVLAEYGMVGAMITEACKRAAVPLVIHYHGADVHQRTTVTPYLPWYKRSFHYASAFVTVSADMAAELVHLGAPAEKIIWNPYGVNTKKFQRVNVRDSAPNFLAVGRFVEKKSPLSSIKAFKMVADQIPEAHLWMVGAGPLLKKAQALSDELNLSRRVTFTGVLSADEIRQRMQDTRCFIQHSVTAADGDMEGTPNTILEAGASGLPVVSTAHAGIKEAVIHGETGYLVAEHDIKQMGAYMLKLATDVELAAQIGERGADYIRKHYDMKTQINSLAAILEQAIKENNA